MDGARSSTERIADVAMVLTFADGSTAKVRVMHTATSNWFTRVEEVDGAAAGMDFGSAVQALVAEFNGDDGAPVVWVDEVDLTEWCDEVGEELTSPMAAEVRELVADRSADAVSILRHAGVAWSEDQRRGRLFGEVAWVRIIMALTDRGVWDTDTTENAAEFVNGPFTTERDVAEWVMQDRYPDGVGLYSKLITTRIEDADDVEALEKLLSNEDDSGWVVVDQVGWVFYTAGCG